MLPRSEPERLTQRAPARARGQGPHRVTKIRTAQRHSTAINRQMPAPQHTAANSWCLADQPAACRREPTNESRASDGRGSELRNVENLGRSGLGNSARVDVDERLRHGSRFDRHRELRDDHLHAARASDARRRARSVRLGVLSNRAWLWADEGLKTRRIQDEKAKQDQEEETAHYLVYSTLAHRHASRSCARPTTCVARTCRYRWSSSAEIWQIVGGPSIPSAPAAARSACRMRTGRSISLESPTPRWVMVMPSSVNLSPPNPHPNRTDA